MDLMHLLIMLGCVGVIALIFTGQLGNLLTALGRKATKVLFWAGAALILGVWALSTIGLIG